MTARHCLWLIVCLLPGGSVLLLLLALRSVVGGRTARPSVERPAVPAPDAVFLLPSGEEWHVKAPGPGLNRRDWCL